ncbi:MAG: hypothetical protein ACK4IK_03615 [Bacteroidia bacterium]
MKNIQQYLFKAPEVYQDLLCIQKEKIKYQHRFLFSVALLVFIILQFLFYYLELFPYNYFNYSFLIYVFVLSIVLQCRLCLHYYQNYQVNKMLLLSLIYILENDEIKRRNN